MSSVDILRDALFGNPPTPSKEPSREGVLAAHADLMLTTQAGIAAAALSGTDLNAAMTLVAPLLQSSRDAQTAAAGSLGAALTAVLSANEAAADAANASNDAALATQEALKAASDVKQAITDINGQVASLIGNAVAEATAEAIAARDAVIPIFGTSVPTSDIGQLNQSYYQKTAQSLLFYGPKTSAGWGDPISLRGLSSGPLGAGSVTADTLSTNGAERAAIADLLPVMQSGKVFVTNFAAGAITPASGLMYFNADLSSSHDLMRLEGTIKATAASYLIHVTAKSESGSSAGGAVGIAMDGVGAIPTLVVNRYGGGNASAILVNKVGTGNGYGIQASFSSLGNGAAASLIKQNANGSIAAGAPCGLGPSLELINRSSQGTALDSTTTANNASLISNILRRENTKEGIVLDVQTVLGGPRSGAYTSLRILHNPSTASTGTAAVAGMDLILGPNIRGSAETSVLTLSNNTSNSTNAFGAVIQALGSNVTNTALRLAAANGTNNIALQVLSGLSTFDGPLDTSSMYRVAGLQVVGGRGAAVPNPTDSATVITAVTALLSRVRDHGLIAA